MEIRKARLSDVEKMNSLKKQTFLKINSKDYPKKVVEEYLKRQTAKKFIQNMKTGDYFILTEKEKLVGIVDLYDRNVIGSLYIKWDEVGKGYGKKLMNFIENYAKKKGLKKVVLYPTITAKKFYEKIGYKPTGKIDTWEIAEHKFKVREMFKILK